MKKLFSLIAVALVLMSMVALPAQAVNTIVVADEGVEILLGTFFNNSPAAQNLLLKLGCNNYVPLRNMTTASFTECTGGNYAAKTLTNGSWTVTTVSTPREADYTLQTFAFTGPLTTNGTIYTLYVTNAAGTKVIWAQALDTAFTPVNNGDNITINPLRLQLSTGTPN